MSVRHYCTRISKEIFMRNFLPCIWPAHLKEFSPTFSKHHISARIKCTPNAVQLLSAETECPPKVNISPHLPLKPKPKLSRPLMLFLDRWMETFNLALGDISQILAPNRGFFKVCKTVHM